MLESRLGLRFFTRCKWFNITYLREKHGKRFYQQFLEEGGMGGKLRAAFCRDEGGRDVGFDPLCSRVQVTRSTAGVSSRCTHLTQNTNQNIVSQKKQAPRSKCVKNSRLTNSFNREANVGTDLVLTEA